MPQPLPAIIPPDNMPTLNAYRVGAQDRIAQDERNLLKEAGGLAAAGNMGGARSALYKGGNFGEARNISQEQRAQAGEGRAAESHARTMKDADLERSLKTYELFGRLIPAIGSDPQKLEIAKAHVGKLTGADLSQVTLENLPMLQQQNISTEQQLRREMEERRFKADEFRANQAQSNTDRSFRHQVEEGRRSQTNLDRSYFADQDQRRLGQYNADRTYNAGREDAGAMQQYRDAQTRILAERAKAASAKANMPKPLTAEQAKAQSFYGLMADAQDVLKGSNIDVGGKKIFKQGALPADESPSPMSQVSNFMATNSPDSALTSAQLNKRQKQYIQSAMQWVRAKLRKESGASIAPEEFSADYRVFFPQPGDDIQTRRNKARARRKAEEGFRLEGAMTSPRGDLNALGADGDFSGLSDADLLKQLQE